MSGLVADASILFKCLLPESGTTAARRMVTSVQPPIAPDMILAECANAVWKRVHRGLLDRPRAMELQAELLAIPLELRPMAELTPEALSLALEFDHPVYDCYYIAAAIHSDCRLATADERLYALAQRVGLGERAILVR